MNGEQAAQIVTQIEVFWQRPRPAGWDAAWLLAISPLPFEPTHAGLMRLVNTSVHPPTVAELRLAVAEVQGTIPPDPIGILGEEWAKVARDAMFSQQWDNFPPAPHPTVAAGVAAFGGVEAVMDDRIGWRKFWLTWRQQAVADAVQDEAILQAHTEALTAGAVVELEA